MKKNILLIFGFVAILSVWCLELDKTSAIAAPIKAQQAQSAKVISATPLNIVASPSKYLNKTVKMQATFDKFSTLGLDYSKALRKSSEYIGI